MIYIADCFDTYINTLIPKVEVTRFEDLEETHAEVKLKQLLWESQKEWVKDYDTWMTVQCFIVELSWLVLCIICIIFSHCRLILMSYSRTQ